MITTKDIVEALSAYLGEIAPFAHVYTFNPDQNMIIPCFIIEPVEQQTKDLLSRLDRYGMIQTYTFSIAFISEDPWDFRTVPERVSALLRFIKLGDGYLEPRNREIHWIDETTATITFDVDIQTVVVEEPLPLMGMMDDTVKVEDGNEI